MKRKRKRKPPGKTGQCSDCGRSDPLGLHKADKEFCEICQKCVKTKNMSLHVKRCIDAGCCDFCQKSMQRRNLEKHIEKCRKTQGIRLAKKRRAYSLQDKFRIVQKYEKLKRRGGDTKEFLANAGINKVQIITFTATCRTACDRFEYLTEKELRKCIKNKDLRGVCPGSGRTHTVFTQAMTDDLKTFIVANRGTAPADVSPVSGPESLDDSEDGYRILTYHSLVNRIFLKFKKEYEAGIRKGRRYQTWYMRVWRWCKTHGYVLRKPNRLQPVDPVKVALAVKRTLREIREALKADGVANKNVANLDETSLRLLAEHTRTLHHKGAKTVKAGKGTGSKLCLSIPVIWFADGRVDMVVVWKSQRKNIPISERWEKRHGIFWFEANTKWSTKERHYQVLRQLMTLDGGTKLYLDDMASGHRGASPDKFLESIGCRRIRIPSNATWLLQPADRPTTNQCLKRLVRRILNEEQFDEKYSEFIKNCPTSLNDDAKNFISSILSTVRKKMNTTKKLKDGIIQAFNETLFSPDDFHSELKKYLEAVQDVVPDKNPGAGKSRHFCPYGCGESWARKTKKAEKAHERDCWYRRTMLMSPLLNCNQNLETERGANSTYTAGLVAKTTLNGNARQIFLGKDDTFHFIGRRWRKVPDALWWQKAKQIRYRKATAKELDAALRRGLIDSKQVELLQS